MPKKRNAKRKDGRIPVQVYLGRAGYLLYVGG